jgi:hypothetical protein
MKILQALVLCALCLGACRTAAGQATFANDDEQSLLRADQAAFRPNVPSAGLRGDLLDPNLTWIGSSGNIRNRSEILPDLKQRNELPTPAGSGTEGGAAIPARVIKAHAYGQLGVIQENRGKEYILRVWIRRAASWQLLIYHAVSTGAPSSAGLEKAECENPCNTVPFEPRNADERDVIHAYQSVERAVTAHDSAAWSAHIADEFIAVTSNSDRPLDKLTRMAGLDNQKVAGIAPFPLVSARMFEFGDAMVMTSVQQPLHGLPLRVTRIWFKRNGAWLEAYSYQTTVQSGSTSR